MTSPTPSFQERVQRLEPLSLTEIHFILAVPCETLRIKLAVTWFCFLYRSTYIVLYDVVAQEHLRSDTLPDGTMILGI